MIPVRLASGIQALFQCLSLVKGVVKSWTISSDDFIKPLLRNRQLVVVLNPALLGLINRAGCVRLPASCRDVLTDEDRYSLPAGLELHSWKASE